MNYYLDTEFLEGTQKKKFLGITYGHTKPTIDLISIGIVSEDNREYYAISKDFNLKEAWNRNDIDPNHKKNYKQKNNYWIRENVLKPIYKELRLKELSQEYDDIENIETYYTNKRYYRELKRLINKYGKTNKQIAEDVIEFTGQYQDTGATTDLNPKFYAFYADYDWVVFCWLFGKMNYLPNGFPKFCNDLKQEFDNQTELQRIRCINNPSEYRNYNLRTFFHYPKQTNKHNALADAHWNKKLHEFLKQL